MTEHPSRDLDREARHEDGVHVLAVGERDRGRQMVDQTQVGGVHLEQHDVRLLAGGERTDPVLHTEGAGTLQGRHPHHVPGGQGQFAGPFAARQGQVVLPAALRLQGAAHLGEQAAADPADDVDAQAGLDPAAIRRPVAG
ncbi:hypothetical protein I2W78_35780 [Streptomyces spinoverrucosus]|nr:hypothetical protein [Streptomyces spinoverrucosus]